MLFLEEVSAAAVAETTKQSFFDTIKAFQIGNISLSGLLSALLILVICAIIIKIITTIVEKALDKSKKIDNTLRHFVTSAIKAIAKSHCSGRMSIAGEPPSREPRRGLSPNCSALWPARHRRCVCASRPATPRT